MPSLPSIKNPFAKKEEKLPGERVAVITDQSLEPADPALAAKPIALPPAVANAAWSDPGGTPSNSLGHLAIGERVNKSWRVDIGTGSSSSGRLSAIPIVADGKVFTLDAGGTVSAFSAAGGSRVWSISVTPKNEKRAEGFGGGLALDSGRLYVTTGYGTVVGIEPGKGSVLWTQKIGEPVRSSPTAAGGKVYFVSTDSVLHCLDGNDGQELWTAKGVPEPATLLSNVSPAVGQGVVIAAFPAGDIARLPGRQRAARLERHAVAHERDDRSRHSRRSVAPGDRPRHRVRGRPRRQDDRGVGIIGRAAVDQERDTARRCRGQPATPSSSSM